MANPQYFTKNLAAASSTGIGSFSSAGVVTFNTSIFDTGRRIVVWGSSALGATITLTGTSETGGPISETIISSTTAGGLVSGIQDFKSLTAVTVSCGVASTTGYLGTSTQGGTPWQIADFVPRLSPMVGVTFDPTSTAISATFDYTRDYPQWVNGSWQNPFTTCGPIPISTMTAVSSRQGLSFPNLPMAAWRLTLSSSSSGAGTLNATVIQQGQ